MSYTYRMRCAHATYGTCTLTHASYGVSTLTDAHSREPTIGDGLMRLHVFMRHYKNRAHMISSIGFVHAGPCACPHACFTLACPIFYFNLNLFILDIVGVESKVRISKMLIFQEKQKKLQHICNFNVFSVKLDTNLTNTI